MDKTEKQLEDLSDKASEIINSTGTKYSGMTYEQGIRDTIDWILGNSDDEPLS